MNDFLELWFRNSQIKCVKFTHLCLLDSHFCKQELIKGVFYNTMVFMADTVRPGYDIKLHPAVTLNLSLGM